MTKVVCGCDDVDWFDKLKDEITFQPRVEVSGNHLQVGIFYDNCNEINKVV